MKFYYQHSQCAKVALWLTLTLLSPAAFAQWGPGGVGNMSGTVVNTVRKQPALRVWFLADSGISQSGGKVSSWADRSGRGIVVSQATGSLQPSYVTNVVSGRPVVRFNGTPSGCLTGNMVASGSVASSAMSLFTVVKNTATSNSNAGLMAFNGFQGLICNYTSPSYKYILDGNGASGSNGAGTASLSSDPNFRVLVGIYGNSANTNNSFFSLDGSPYPVYSGTNVGISAYSQLQIGGRTWGTQPNRIFNGDIAEAFAFDTQIDSAERIIIETYLAAKYAVTIARNRYPHAPTHRFEVGGIGQAFNGSKHDSANSGILTVASPQTLANNRYFFIGHDNASLALGTTETPANDVTFTRRIAREWRVAKSGGDLGTTKLYVDFSTLNASVPAGFTRGIFIDADGDFRTGAQFIDLLPSQANVYVTPASNIPSGYFVTVGAVKRVVAWQYPTRQGFEDQTEYPLIQGGINYPYTAASNLDVVVDFTLAGYGTYPASGPCYDPNGCRWESGRSQLIIPAGQQYVDINLGAFDVDAGLRIHNDTIPQPNGETVRLTIQSVANASKGNQLTMDYTIIDDDYFRKVGYVPGQTAISWNELDAGQYKDTTFIVTLPTGQTGGPSFVLVVGTGTAKAGKDYQLLDAIDPSRDSTVRIMFDTLDQTSLVRVRLMGDNINENTETVTFTLTKPSSATLSAINPITASLTIYDNDPLPTVTFSPASASGNEGVGSVLVKVKLNVESGKLLTIPFSVTGGTATGLGVDYSVLSPSPIYMNPGDTVAFINIAVIEDDIEEDDETIILTLGSPTNATLSSPSAFTYTIVDNDVYGSTGPGGVDRNDGTGSLELWFAADQSVTVSGTNVTKWANLSGRSGRDAAPASSSPTFVASGVNGKPIVRFSGQDLKGVLISSIPSYPITILTVAKQNTAPSGGNSLGSIFCTDRWAGISSYGTNYLTEGFTTTPSFIYPSASNTSTAALSGGGISSFNLLTAQYTQNSTQNSYLYRNSVLEGNYTGTGVALDFHSNFHLGIRHPSNSGNYFKGDVAEVVLLSSLLNGARRIIVENYLAAKYGLTISNNYFSAAPTAYGNSVSGIGTTDGSSGNKHRAASSVGLTFRQLNNSLNANNEYIFFGQNAGAASVTVQTIAGKQKEVWTREWFVQKTGNIDASLTFSYDDVGITHLPLDISEYSLLYKTSPGGTWTYATTDAQTMNGNLITFNVSNANLPNGYYTLGRTNPAILPVVFGSFTALRKGGDVQLRWTTLSEESSDKFVIERSANGADFASIGNVLAAGNSNQRLNYAFVDATAPAGNLYYRLRQVDESGKWLLSPTRRVDNRTTSAGFSRVSLYPNPVLDVLSISLPDNEQVVSLSVADARGVAMQTPATRADGGGLVADMAYLKPGLYLVRVQLLSGEVLVRSMVKQ